MHNSIYKYKKIGTGCLLAALFTACTSDEYPTQGEGDPNKTTVQIASVQEETTTKATLPPPPNATYYLSYQTGATEADLKLKALNITSGAIGETGLYWANLYKEVNGKSSFTLSNVGEDKGNMAFPADKDILWNSQSAWMTPLAFVLNHTMAQVWVKLTNTLSTSVKSVSITAVKQGIDFNRHTGETKANGTGTELTLTKDGTETSEVWKAILPPQARADEMVLTVKTNDDKTYKRKLPYSMQQGNGNDWESIVLKFRSGYTLELAATITDNIDYTIYFTGATLQNWSYKGDHSVVAKPAGIYTAIELEDWATIYNNYKKDISKKNEEALLRYGTYDLNNSKWTFTIRRNIDVTGKTIPSVDNFSDNFKTSNNYKISGIVKTKLFTGTISGDVDDDIFETK